MGMYDNIKFDYPLPNAEDNKREFQTKDTPAQFLDTYTVDKDGQLWSEVYDIEDRSDPKETGIKRLFGIMSRVNIRPRKDNFTGTIDFYDEEKAFTADFVNGKIVKVCEH